MKKNILYFYILAVVLFAASAFTACSNNDEQANGTPVNTYTITVNATKGDDVSSAPSNRALSFVGPTLTATWTKDDVVAVYKSETHLGDLTAQSAGASTTLTGTLEGTIEVNDELTLKFLSPNYASQTGTLAYIAANCDYATATVTVSSIDGNNITTSPANFSNQQAIVKFTLKDTGGSSISASQLVVTANGTSYTVTPTSATSELFVAVPGIASKNVTLTAKEGTTTYSFVNSSATFVNGKYYTVSVKMSSVAAPTSGDIGKVIGLDAKIYATKDAATSAGTTPIAMIAYVGSPNLAIALSDDASDSFTDAGKNAAGHTPKVALGTWRMPSKDDWQNMFTGCGISGDGETSYNPGNWTNKGFRDKLTACGADIQTNNPYWTSSEINSYNAYAVIFSGTQACSCSFQPESKSESQLKVRAVFEF